MRHANKAAYWLVIIGAINWGLIGLVQFNLLNAVLGAVAGIEQIVYVLIGISGVYLLINQAKGKKK